MTCVGLRRELEDAEEAQMCARGEFDVHVPRRLVGLVAAAFHAARKVVGRHVSSGECLGIIARQFLEVWTPALAERSSVQKEVLARDRGLCRVPGCSRAAAHVHHIVYRSAGGEDDPGNLVSLCAAHHLHGVHMGYVRVRGSAPDGLQWELGA
jgi:HNH endonuclease